MSKNYREQDKSKMRQWQSKSEMISLKNKKYNVIEINGLCF